MNSSTLNNFSKAINIYVYVYQSNIVTIRPEFIIRMIIIHYYNTLASYNQYI
jgi:hypothetical protein